MQKIPVRMLQQIGQKIIGLMYLKNFVQIIIAWIILER